MSINTYDIGDLVRSSAAFVDGDDSAADPTTIQVKYKINNGEVTTKVYGVDGEVVKDSVGNYHIDITTTEDGDYYIRWTGTGTIIAAGESTFFVRTSTVI